MRKLNTGDLFKVCRIIKHAGLKEDVKNCYKQGKSGADSTEIGVNFALVLVDAMAEEKIEDEICSFLAGIAEVDDKTIKEWSVDRMIEMFSEVAKENDLKGFFKLAASLTKA